MNMKKVLQIVAHVLHRHSDRLNYTKLIKLLYIADREALSKWDVPITGDHYAALHNGPIVSGIYNLIMERHNDRDEQLQWSSAFVRDEYDLVARCPRFYGNDELSDREEHVIDEIDTRYCDWSFNQLIEHTHDRALFPEWEDPGSTSTSIPLRRVLLALGRTEEEIAEILSCNAACQIDQHPPQPKCE